MDPSAAEANSAQQQQRQQHQQQHSAPSPSPVQLWGDDILHARPLAGGDALEAFAMDDNTKQALLSFIVTGQAPKEQIKQLYEHCLSGLVKAQEALDASMGVTAPEAIRPALPPTPATPEDEATTPTREPLQGVDLPRDLKEFFIYLQLSGKIPPTELEKLYSLSPLAGTLHFTSLMQSPESHQNPNMESATYVKNRAAYLAAARQYQAGQQAQQPSQQPPQLTGTRVSNSYELTSPSLASQSLDIVGPVSRQQADSPQHSPTFIAPAFMNQAAASWPTDHQLVSPTHPMLANYDPVAPAMSFNQQTGLISPVATRASSQSEGSSTPTAPQAIVPQPTAPQTIVPHTMGGPAEVICPILNNDGTICGKRCGGAKPFRSIQEHIRRAHPEKYLQGLPATEESFRSMVQAGGICCTIADDDDNVCGERFTGNKRFRTIQDHVRDKHPDHWVSDLPANEHTYNILMKKDDTVDCPLPRSDGRPCTKHTFGEKRWRSLQEHIRRAHPNYYQSGLNATEESIMKMVKDAGFTMAPPRRSKKIAKAKTKQKVLERPRQQRVLPAEVTASSTEVSALQEQPMVAPPADQMQQAFEASYFPPSVQTTSMTATLAPSALEADGFPPSAMDTAFSPLQESFQAIFGNDDLYYSDLGSLQHAGLGLSLATVATPTAQNLNQTLTPELFSGHMIPEQHAMQKVYGDSYNATGFGQLAQPFVSLQGIQPLSPLQSLQQSQSDGFLFPADETSPVQHHPISFSQITPPGASNVALSMPHGFPQKRRASQINGLDINDQNQSRKRSSLGRITTSAAPLQKVGAPISPRNLAPSTPMDLPKPEV